MTTATLTTAIAQTSTATFDAWVNEMDQLLVTTLGLTRLPAAMDTGQMAVPSVTAVPGAANTSSGYYMYTFNDVLGQGPLVTATALLGLTAGTGYNGGSSGTVAGVALSGGTGTGAVATVVFGAAGVISSITPTNGGTGYNIGDKLIVTSANVVSAGGAAGGGSSGFAHVHRLSVAASPIIFKLEFGSGSLATNPAMWITMGTSWASNGTLAAASNGAVTTRLAIGSLSAPSSTSTPANTLACYNTTYGFLGVVHKLGVNTGVNNVPLSSFFIARSSGSSGTPISNGACLWTGSNATTSAGTGNLLSPQQCISYTNNIIFPTFNSTSSNSWSGAPGANASAVPYNLTSTLANGLVNLFPIFVPDPNFRYAACMGSCFPADIPFMTTFTTSIIGATTLTFINCGLGFPGGVLNAAGLNLCMLWQ